MAKKEEDYIKKFNQNRRIITQFLIKDKTVKRTKNNKPYLELVLQDKTGQIKGRVFNKKAYNLFENIETNKVYNIVGKVEEFPVNSKKYNILIDKIVLANDFNDEDFIRVIENHDSHINYFINTIKSLEDKDLKLVLDSLFEDKELFEKFITAPAAKKYHHNYQGGLLVHTNEVIEICKTICNLYEDIDKDLLLTGAILHDIGKIETYDYETESIEMKPEGIMLEHLFIGGCLVKEKLNKIDIPHERKIELIHLILSHHGKVENGWGSCIDPKTPEAIALHHADDMSAKITNSLEI